MKTHRVGIPTREVDGDRTADRLAVQDLNGVSGHPRCKSHDAAHTMGVRERDSCERTWSSAH